MFSTNLADKFKLKSKPYASKQAKLTGRLKINKSEKNKNNIDLMPILIGELKAHPKKSNWHKVKILVDSGASASIIHERFVSDLPRQKGKGVTWSTMGLTYAKLSCAFRN